MRGGRGIKEKIQKAKLDVEFPFKEKKVWGKGEVRKKEIKQDPPPCGGVMNTGPLRGKK